MTLRSIVIAIATFASLVVVSTPCRAEENFLAAVIAQLPQATVSLDQALKTSESEGTPLSAEYDVDDGELQISVYTKKDDEFEEVVIDAKSGSIKSTKPLSEPAEVIEAQAQSAALDKSKLSLTAALDAAVSANSGYRTVSIIPTLGDNEAVANITLLRGDNLKQVAEKLD